MKTASAATLTSNTNNLINELCERSEKNLTDRK